MKLVKLNNRLLFPSPTVQAGWQNESFRTDFQHIKTLGKGAFGIVWQARHKKTGNIYAIKQIKKKSITTAKLIQHVKTEVKIMYLLNHPHIVKLYNHFQDDFSIYFVLQFAQNGQLYKKMLQQSPQKYFSQEKSSRYIRQVVEALKYIHFHNIIHRDIKPQNILIDKNDNLKLSDFGWSNFVEEIHEKRETYCGTLDYLAPEMIQKTHQHDYRVDIWSVGVLVYELINGYSPFSHELLKANNMNELKVKQNISSVNYKFPIQMSQDAKDLVSKLLVKQPCLRLSLDQILGHAWIKKHQITQQTNEYLQDKWYSNIKNEFSTISNINQADKTATQTFSQQEIYKCTRVEGILSKRIDQGLQRQTQKDKKIVQLQLRVKQLQLRVKIKDQQGYQLQKTNQNLTKFVSLNQHEQCRQRKQKLMTTIKQQSEQIKNMHIKILDNQRKLRQFSQVA